MISIFNYLQSIIPSSLLILAGCIIGSIIFHILTDRKKLKESNHIIQEQRSEIDNLNNQIRICYISIEFLYNQLPISKSNKPSKSVVQFPFKKAQPTHEFNSSSNLNQERQSAIQ
jgi:hypothetical protein